MPSASSPQLPVVGQAVAIASCPLASHAVAVGRRFSGWVRRTGPTPKNGGQRRGRAFPCLRLVLATSRLSRRELVRGGLHLAVLPSCQMAFKSVGRKRLFTPGYFVYGRVIRCDRASWQPIRNLAG